MHIWQVRKVVRSLRAGPLSEAEQVKYFAAYFLLFALGLSLPIDSDARAWAGRYGFFTWLAYTTVAVAGAVSAYWLNRRGDGKAFVQRFIALFVPLTLQSLALVAFAVAVVSVNPDRLPQSAQAALYNASWLWGWFWFGLQLLAECLLFVRLAVNIRRVSSPPNAS